MPRNDASLQLEILCAAEILSGAKYIHYACICILIQYKKNESINQESSNGICAFILTMFGKRKAFSEKT